MCLKHMVYLFDTSEVFKIYKYLKKIMFLWCLGFPGGSLVKNPPANVGDVDLNLGSGRSLGNLMNKGAWQGHISWGHKESDMM